MAGSNGTGYFDDSHLDDVASWDGESSAPVEPGDYEAEIMEVTEAVSSNDNPMLVVTFGILGAADGSETEMTGRNIRGRYVRAGKGRGRLRNFLESIGIGAPWQYGVDDLVGKKLLFTVVGGEYTKMDPQTGEEETRQSANVQKERALPEPVKNSKGKSASVKPPQDTKQPAKTSQARR